MQTISTWISDTLGISPATQEKIFLSLLTIVVVWLARWLLLRAVRRGSEEATLHYRWRKITSYVAYVVSIVTIGRIWLIGLQSVITYLGLLSAGLIIALSDPITSMAGWLFIIWRRPFEVGDRIQVGEHAGDVVDLRFFQFSLLEIGNWVAADQSTGRVLHIPNKDIFSLPIANYSRGINYIWNEIPVVLTFESDWKKAKMLLNAALEEYMAMHSVSAREEIDRSSRDYMIRYGTVTPTVYTDVVDIGVRLTLRYLVRPRERRSSMQQIWEVVLDIINNENDIALAYPTTRVYFHPGDESPQATGSPSENKAG